MEENFFIGHEIRKLSYVLKRTFANTAKFENHKISAFQMNVILLVKQNEEENKITIQKDIEQNFGIQKATVSLNLNQMQQAGFIVRESVEHDARLKKIVLTKEAELIYEDVKKHIVILEEALIQGLSEEEIFHLKNCFEKIGQNAKQFLNHI